MITQRQKEILLAIISEFMNSADEVGSLTLVQKYGMDVSSATVRNEMVHLMDEGYLEKSHISSGRFPTDQALRLYVKELGTNVSMSAVDEALVRQELFKVRFSQEELIKQILDVLVEKLDSAAFVFTNDYNRYYGVSSLMKYEELKNIDVLRRVLDVLEDRNLLNQVFTKYTSDQVSMLIGQESGLPDLQDCVIAFTKVNMHRNSFAHMGIIGSRRINYGKVIPLLNSIKESVETSLRGWR